jgi:peroxiredoxin
MSQAFGDLPAELPEPLDDGLADHLEGMEVPPVRLRSTEGKELDLRDLAAGLLVAYVYPKTGVPGEPLPVGWDDIPGARGCTPQSCAFRDRMSAFTDQGATVVGISGQALEEQHEFAAREHIPYSLLNDSAFLLAETLGLPTFETEGARFYKRLTFLAEDSQIVKVFYPVFPPDRNAADVLGWLGGGRE